MKRFVFAAVVAGLLWATTVEAAIERVILISVDGLRGDFLQALIAEAPTEVPNFKRLRDEGASTFNARCDATYSETLPNHVSMITGRPVTQPAGQAETVHHGFIYNVPESTSTIHQQGNPAVPYKVSIFDVVHDRGLTTGLYLSKGRLQLINRSYNATTGAVDEISPDHGRNKFTVTSTWDNFSEILVNDLLSRINGSQLPHFTMLHIVDPDTAAHGVADGWNINVGSKYRFALKSADTRIGAVLNALAAKPLYAGKTAIIVTADHGGGGNAVLPYTHHEASFLGNNIIPFIVWAPGFAPGSDLHTYFENRFDPGDSIPDYNAAAQPIRNVDAGNLVADLLGVPPIPGSSVRAALKRPLEITPVPEGMQIIWPVYLTGHVLEKTGDLVAGVWEAVTTGVTESNGKRRYLDPVPLPASRFYHLRLPQ